MPTVSVIVPNYNHAPYLPVRLKTILEQTYSDFELLILDDCSPDNSREVIDRFAADHRVRVAFNTRNSGNTYLQWQKGLDLTSGDYVWIAESDDFADTRFLERMVPMLQNNPQAGLTFCETVVVDEEGKELGGYTERNFGQSGLIHDALNQEFVQNGPDYIRDLMFPWNTIPNASAVLFRRKALQSVGGPVTSMRICGDWLLYCKILSRWDVGHIPDRFNYFRQHNVNVRSNVQRAALAREWLDVATWLQKEVGRIPRAKRRQSDRYVAEVLLGIDRVEPGNQVAFRSMLGALRRAGDFAPSLLLPTARSLVRQIVGSIVRGVGLRNRL